MTDKKIKRIPYGLANYELMVQQNCYYVDKTMFLAAVENAGNYLFFIRPRRFGKSLFLSVMEAYYDVFYKDRFEEFFKDTWIFDHPTEEKGAYLMLSFNFSVVEPDPDKMEASFLNHVQDTAVDFIRRYNVFLSINPDLDYFSQKIKNSLSASDILSTLLLLCKGVHQKLYVIIDEYDNFSNTILSNLGQEAYQKLTHGPGFFRSFFNSLKKGTTGTGAPITRSLISGVSPVTMDDVTSGYNIGENVSLDAAFNSMLGFTSGDVKKMLSYYQSAGLITHDPEYLGEIIDKWYGNYLFSKHSNTYERLYNSDMVLYFFKEYFKNQSLPDDLIDRNVRIDYGKLKHLIIIDKAEKKVSNGNFERLRHIVEEGKISSSLVQGFPLEKLRDRENFISLLFYFGLLTIKDTEAADLVLEIPNETIRRLYYNYIKEGYEETEIFALDLYTYNSLMKGMALKGEWRPLFDYITHRMQESMSLRDLVTGEKSIQAFLNVYLGLSNLYIIHVEKELNKGYADIVMEPFVAHYQDINYAYILEIKYTKAGLKSGDPKIQQLKSEAEEQLNKYSMDEKLKRALENTHLIKLALIFSGHKLVDLFEVN
jgi:hypothetical protein